MKLLALYYHSGQFRRDGVTPYINHVEAVVRRLNVDPIAKEFAEMVAWLHDVLEDNPEIGPEDLLWSGVPRDVVECVVVLTKKGGDYEGYLARVKADETARRVKIADMLANLSDTPSEAQVIKYARGLLFLHNVAPLATGESAADRSQEPH